LSGFANSFLIKITDKNCQQGLWTLQMVRNCCI